MDIGAICGAVANALLQQFRDTAKVLSDMFLVVPCALSKGSIALNFCSIRSIIENYMKAKQLAQVTCSFRMQVNRTDYTLGEFALVYCDLQMLRTNC